MEGNRFDNLDPKYKEFFKSVGYSMFLASQNDETSLRQAYIMLDNSVEHLLVGLLKDKKEYFKFHEILNDVNTMFPDLNDLPERLSQCHNVRNILYHKSSLVTVSLNRFKEYLNVVITLCEKTGLTENSNVLLNEYKSIISKFFDRFNSKVYDNKQIVIDIIKDNFQLSPGKYHVDLMLGSPCGYSYPAIENIETLISGIVHARGKDKKGMILELIEANEENASHSFFISRKETGSWFCFINCFWSKWGEGDRSDIKYLRELFESNDNHLIYRQDFVRKGLLEIVFDPQNSIEKYFRI